MRLKGMDFGHVLGASGVQGFFGEDDEYWYHRPYFKRLLGPDFTGMTFVAKTMTLEPRLDPAKKLGNMPLKADGITPTEIYPDCIVIRPLAQFALNAVGLSNPGADNLLGRNRWQWRDLPFMLSYMSVKETMRERLDETWQFAELLDKYRSTIRARIGLQLNFSCPNVDHKAQENVQLVKEVHEAIEYLRWLDIPLMPKLDVTMDIAAAKDISEHPSCDAICVTNTVKFGKLSNKIAWNKLFLFGRSPLKKYGGGGYSGRQLYPLMLDWVTRLRNAGVTKPINAGGGILYPADVDPLVGLADSIFIGSMAFLRPWNVKPTIQRANRLFAEKERRH